MKKILAILLAAAMLMSMAIVTSADNLSVSDPQTTDDGKNIAFALTKSVAEGETAVVHLTGTTDTDFRVWLGSLHNAASDIAYMIMEGEEFEFLAELTATGSCSTVTLKTINSWDSNVTSNTKTTLAGVTVESCEVFYGTMEEYEASLAPETDGDGVMIGGVKYNETVVLNVETFNDAPIADGVTLTGWGWNNFYTYGMAGSFDALLSVLDGTYIKVTITDGATEAPFYQTSGNATTPAELFGESGDSLYYDAAILFEEASAAGDQGWGNVVLPGKGSDAVVTGFAFVKLEEAPIEVATKTGKCSGYMSTGDETHLILIKGAAITTPHEFVDGACKLCGHVAPEDDVIVVEVVDPTESTTEEEEDTTVEAEENPETGLALAVVPAIVAIAAVALSKKR